MLIKMDHLKKESNPPFSTTTIRRLLSGSRVRLVFHVCVVLALISATSYAVAKVDPFHPWTYCSLPSQLEEARAIPPPKFESSASLTLSQVNIIHRHGARTADKSASNNCWVMNKDKPRKWDCTFSDSIQSAQITDVPTTTTTTTTPTTTTTTPTTTTTTPTTTTTTPKPNITAAMDDDVSPNRNLKNVAAYKPGEYISSDYLGIPFTTVFDVNPEFNTLGGTCLTGQLTMLAKDQFDVIGGILHDAYFKGDKPLFTYAELKKNPNLLFMRSTNVQRTKASVNLLVSSLMQKIYADKTGDNYWETAIPDELLTDNIFAVHTEEKLRDTMSGEGTFCPTLFDGVKSLKNSQDVTDMKKKHSALYSKLGGFAGKNITHFFHTSLGDCFMSDVCPVIDGSSDTQQFLPPELRVTATSDNTTLGVQLWQAIQEEQALALQYNNSELSKCKMSNFFVDLLEGFNVDQTKYKTVKSDNYNAKSSKFATQSKLAVYSGHDSTVQPVLASLGIFDGSWPSFASMITIEIYSDPQKSSFFRIIYNSQDLTGKVNGCSKSDFFKANGVCEFQTLLDELSWVKVYPLPHTNPTPAPPSDNSMKNFIYVVIGIVIGVIVVLVGVGAYKWFKRSKQTGYQSA